MLGKYKKMSLAAAACALLGVSASDAAVTLTFAQSGPNVTATWSGTYALPTGGITGTLPAGYSSVDGNSVLGLSAGAYMSVVGGTNLSSAISQKIGSYVGDTFGFAGSSLIFPVGTSGVYSPVGTMTFSGQTLTTLGVSGFNNRLAFTGTGDSNGDRTISYTTIPEPSGVALIAVGCLAAAFRRRGGCA